MTLKHSYQQFPQDPVIDLLRNPYYSTEFKTIANGSITWNIDKFSATDVRHALRQDAELLRWDQSHRLCNAVHDPAMSPARAPWRRG